MKLRDVVAVLREIAPEHLAASWDKVGLQAGSLGQTIRGVLLCIDLTEAVMAEALERRCNLVVAYHPPIFHPLTRLTDDTWKQRVMIEAVRRRVAIYTPHTALDNVRGGLTDWLCEGLGRGNVTFTITEAPQYEHRHVVVTWVPRARADRVRRAMERAGAGAYAATYHGMVHTAEGHTHWQPVAGADAVGSDVRIEAVCDRNNVGDVVEAARRAHPMTDAPVMVGALAPAYLAESEAPGTGRVHHLRHAVTPATLARRLKRHLGVTHLKLAVPDLVTPDGDVPGKVSSIAVCPGAGGSVFERYTTVDAFVTGEMQHHQVLDLVSRGKVVLLAGHTVTERPFLPVYRERIADRLRGDVECHVSAADRAPMRVWS